MEKWEYFTQTITAKPGYILEVDQEELDILGNQGWELVSILPISCEKTGLVGTGLTLEQCQLILKRRRPSR